jgi:hypothetical protein
MPSDLTNRHEIYISTIITSLLMGVIVGILMPTIYFSRKFMRLAQGYISENSQYFDFANARAYSGIGDYIRQNNLENVLATTNIPPQFICNRTGKFMLDPVVLRGDGMTYDRINVPQGLLDDSQDGFPAYVPNLNLRAQALEFLEMLVKERAPTLQMTAENRVGSNSLLRFASARAARDGFLAALENQPTSDDEQDDQRSNNEAFRFN